MARSYGDVMVQVIRGHGPLVRGVMVQAIRGHGPLVRGAMVQAIRGHGPLVQGGNGAGNSRAWPARTGVQWCRQFVGMARSYGGAMVQAIRGHGPLVRG